MGWSRWETMGPEGREDMVERVTVGMVGMGAMAQALLRGWLELTSPRLRWVAYDPDEAIRGVVSKWFPDDRLEWVDGNDAVASASDVVVLAVKPQHAQRACGQIAAGGSNPPPLVLSIAAGVPLRQLASWLGHDRIIRVMPNTPCLVRRGAGGFSAGSGASCDDVALAEVLLAAVGEFFPLPEQQLDAVTGLSGSGPAFVFVMVEALADAGVAAGLPRRVALALAARTVEGAAAMVTPDGPHPGELKDRVASPGGTTIAGLEQLEAAGVRAGLMAAVKAAAARASELGDTGARDAPAPRASGPSGVSS